MTILLKLYKQLDFHVAAFDANRNKMHAAMSSKESFQAEVNCLYHADEMSRLFKLIKKEEEKI